MVDFDEDGVGAVFLGVFDPDFADGEGRAVVGDDGGGFFGFFRRFRGFFRRLGFGEGQGEGVVFLAAINSDHITGSPSGTITVHIHNTIYITIILKRKCSTFPVSVNWNTYIFKGNNRIQRPFNAIGFSAIPITGQNQFLSNNIVMV